KHIFTHTHTLSHTHTHAPQHSIPCRSVFEQDTEPLIAPDVQCAISVNVKMCIHPCKSLWIKASAKCKCNVNVMYTVSRSILATHSSVHLHKETGQEEHKDAG